jgi:cysteine desulfurase family protein (TIGR01976 family)
MTHVVDRAAGGAAAPRPRDFDVVAVRSHFPSLRREIGQRTVAYLDGPAGTQVPDACVEAIAAYLGRSNANSHGAFAASEETDELLRRAHQAAADFLGAGSGDEIVFGANMTTLTFAASRAIGRTLHAGDEIVVTRLDHDANVAPWLALQEERGAVIRWVPIHPEDCTLDLEALQAALGPRTRLVAIGLASNAVGTINPIREIAGMAHAAGAQLWVDAVHAGPHLPIDVASLGCDFLVCSAYKFYGPHIGLLWGRRAIMEALPAYKVRPADDEMPHRFETGTQAHELLAGLLGTFRYLEWIGTAFGGGPGRAGGDDGQRGARLKAAMHASRAWERDLALALVARVGSVPGVRIRGITDARRVDERCPTIAFTVAGRHPRDVAAFLGRRAISVWDGDYYAYELIRALGLAETGGMVRVGLVHYNTPGEIDRLAEALEELSTAG